jgi:hypothetical protein
MVNVQGFTVAPLEQAAPVTFHPENDQLDAGVAVMFTISPTGCEHPDAQDGVTAPVPTTVVVKVAEAAKGRIVSDTGRVCCPFVVSLR